MKSGIYKILNLVNGKIYVGSAVELVKRWREHKYHLNRKTHKNIHLQNAWNKYWSISFEFIILEYCDIEKLIEREQYYIDNLKPDYNLALTAGSRLGVPMSEEAKAKIGAANKISLSGRVMSQEAKDAIALANKGRQFTLGHKQTPEHIAKRVAANTGKVRTDETKLRMSKVRLGMKFSDEHKANLSLAAKRRREKQCK